MSDDTTTLLFQSDITANIDTSAARESLGDLEKFAESLGVKVKDVFGDLDKAFDTVASGVKSTMNKVGDAIISQGGILQATDELATEIARHTGESIKKGLSFLPKQLLQELKPDTILDQYNSLLASQQHYQKIGKIVDADALQPEIDRVRQRMTELGVSIVETDQKIDYAMRSMAPNVIQSLQGIGRALKLVGSENTGLAGSVPVAVNAIGDLGKSLGLIDENGMKTIGTISAVSEKVLGFFGKVAGGAPQLDGAMLQVINRLTQTISVLKQQQQVFSRLYEEEEREIKKSIQEHQAALAAKEGVSDEEVQMHNAAINALEERSRAMRVVYRTNISLIGTEITRAETNLAHMATTYKNTGRVSGERIRDLERNLSQMNVQLKEAGKSGLANLPNLSNWFKRAADNIGVTGRAVQELTAHEKRLAATNQEVGVSFAAMDRGVGGLRGAISRIIPFIGRGGALQKGVNDMASGVRGGFNQVNQSVSQSTQGLQFALGNLDPVFMDITMGGQMMGQSMDAVMLGMAANAESGASRIVKSFNVVKLAAAAIIAMFGAVVLGAAKLASQVTTLNVTMEVVAKNAGYNIDEMRNWVEVLKDTGITTREATDSVIQFMKAKLPTNWVDPVTEAEQSISDLARSAQNLAVSMGINSSEAFERFIYYVQTGNSQLLDAVGIASTASMMENEYAKAIGKTAKALSPMEKYQARITGLMREASKTTGVYEKAMETAGKQMQSMARYIEELRLSWGRHFEPMLAKVISLLNDFIKALTDVPDKTKNIIATIGTLAGAFAGLVTVLGMIGPKVGVGLKMLKPLLGLLTGKVGIIIALASVLAKAFFNIKMPKDVSAIADGMGKVVEKIKELWSTVQDRLQPISDWVSGFANMVSYHFDRIVERVRGFADRIKESISGFAARNPEFVAFVENIKTVLGDLFTTIWNVVDKVLTAIENLIDQDWNSFFSNMREAGTLILSWAYEAFSNIATVAFEWGKKLIASFANGIVSWAKTAIPDAMQGVGKLISDFLESHSPPKKGVLAGIQDWGKSLFETYLSGFTMADFDVLDRGLDLIRQRLQTLVGESQSAAGDIAAAMGKVRTAIAEAIYQARASGGPLDLSALKTIIVGTLTAYAQDIADLLGAIFSALQAEEAYNNLQKQIAAAREARQAAIDAAQDQLDAINDEIDSINDQMEDLREQMEAQIQAQLEAMGLIVDEKLMDELRRQLEEANVEIRRAQRRIERVRAQAGKYGVNVLTWEEVNAQAQLDLAEQRRDQIQDQIDVQEELRREADRIRAEIEAQYEAQFKALEAELKALQDRAESQQDYIEELRKQNEAASKSEEAQLKAAQDYANKMKSAADLMAKLLEERMKAEKDAADATKAATEGEEKITESIKAQIESGKRRLAKILEREHILEEAEKGGVGTESGLFGTAREAIAKALEGGFPGVVALIGTSIGGFFNKIGGWLTGKLGEVGGWILEKTGLDKVFNDIKNGTGVIGYIATLISSVAENVSAWIDGIKGFLAPVKELITEVMGKMKEEWAEISSKISDFGAKFKKGWAPVANWIKINVVPIFDKIADVLSPIIDIISRLVSGTVRAGWELINKIFSTMLSWSADGIKAVIGIISEFVQIIIDLITLDFDALGKDFEELKGEFGKLWDAITVIFQEETWDKIIAWLTEFGKKIWSALGSIVEEIKQKAPEWFESAKELGRMLIDGVAAKVAELASKLGPWLSDDVLPKLKEKAGEFLGGGVALGIKIWEGIKTKIGEIASSIGAWFVGPGGVSDQMLVKKNDLLLKAKELGQQIYEGIKDRLIGPEGIISKIQSWIDNIIAKIKEKVVDFYGSALELGGNIINGIKDGIESGLNAISDVVKDLWNDYLRPGLQTVLNNVIGFVNGIINAVNAVSGTVGLGTIPLIEIPQLPELKVGGIVLDDIIAQLHANEIVLPLDRLPDLMSGALTGQKQVPAFAPTIILQGNATPGQVQPAIRDAYNWWLEEQRRAS